MNLLMKSQYANPEKPGKSTDSEGSATQDAAVGAENEAIDPHLAVINQFWAGLPAAVRAGILAMIAPTSTSGPAFLICVMVFAVLAK